MTKRLMMYNILKKIKKRDLPELQIALTPDTSSNFPTIEIKEDKSLHNNIFSDNLSAELDLGFQSREDFEERLMKQHIFFRQMIIDSQNKIKLVLRPNAVQEFLRQTEKVPIRAAYDTLLQDLQGATQSDWKSEFYNENMPVKLDTPQCILAMCCSSIVLTTGLLSLFSSATCCIACSFCSNAALGAEVGAASGAIISSILSTCIYTATALDEFENYKQRNIARKEVRAIIPHFTFYQESFTLPRHPNVPEEQSMEDFTKPSELSIRVV